MYRKGVFVGFLHLTDLYRVSRQLKWLPLVLRLILTIWDIEAFLADSSLDYLYSGFSR